MKIIIIMDHLGSGGVNSVGYDLCRALKEQGQSVFLIGIQDINHDEQLESLEKMGIPVFCLGAKDKKSAICHYIPALRRQVKEIAGNEQTVCNLHLKLSVLMGAIATIGLKNVACVETYHNTYHHYWLQCTVLRPRIKKYICVSKTAEEEMWRRFQIPQKKTIAIPNGVSRTQIQELAANYGDKDDNHETLKVVSVGRFTYEKNFLTSVEAMAELNEGNIYYTVVGTGPQEDEAKQIASSNANIKFTGALPRHKAMQELAQSDIVLMPSLWEGRSILQLEAMALDKPLILSDVPGLREPFDEPPLEDGELYRVTKWGYLVRTMDKESYKAVVRHYANNKARYEKIKSYIRNISAENDMSEVANKYIETFEEVIHSRD